MEVGSHFTYDIDINNAAQLFMLVEVLDENQHIP
jgi:hypothetical protein